MIDQTEFECEMFNQISRALEMMKFSMRDEAMLQSEIADCLLANGVEFQREVVLGPNDRIDFLCAGGIGIEVKINGSAAAIARQLKRYEASDKISGLILASRVLIDPRPVGFSKPVHTVWLSRALL